LVGSCGSGVVGYSFVLCGRATRSTFGECLGFTYRWGISFEPLLFPRTRSPSFSGTQRAASIDIKRSNKRSGVRVGELACGLFCLASFAFACDHAYWGLDLCLGYGGGFVGCVSKGLPRRWISGLSGFAQVFGKHPNGIGAYACFAGPLSRLRLGFVAGSTGGRS